MSGLQTSASPVGLNVPGNLSVGSLTLNGVPLGAGFGVVVSDTLDAATSTAVAVPGMTLTGTALAVLTAADGNPIAIQAVECLANQVNVVLTAAAAGGGGVKVIVISYA